MVAIVIGQGAGLFEGHVARGLGGAQHGQGRENIYVNAASGRLVVQRQDEIVQGRAGSHSVLRTYNSQGELAGGWYLGDERRVQINAAKAFRRTSDGSRQEFDLKGDVYVSREGTGADDTLKQLANGDWVWRESSSGLEEVYRADAENSDNFRLHESRTPNGQSVRYHYTGRHLTTIEAFERIDDIDHLEYGLDYVYDGDRLVSESVRYSEANSAEQKLTRTYYKYQDGKLYQVLVDLSPEDNIRPEPDANGAYPADVYVTTYTYQGDLLTGIRQSDGNALTITYQDNRVSALVDALGRVTSFSYIKTDTKNETRMIDPLGAQTTYAYDDQQRLKSVSGPTVHTDKGAQLQELKYDYDAAGRLVSVTDNGDVTTYAYDAQGNVTRQEDGAGNRIERSYSGDNLLLIETVTSGQSQKSETTHYAYDDRRNLRFVVSGEGRVTEYVYDQDGLRVRQQRYDQLWRMSKLEAAQPLVISQLENWIAGQHSSLPAPTALAVEQYQYDVRGQLKRVSREGQDRYGNPITIETLYHYDAAGQLLTKTDPNGGMTSYSYDGLWRLSSTIDAAQTMTQVFYDAANGRIERQIAGVTVETSTYDAMGQLTGRIRGGTLAKTELPDTAARFDAAGADQEIEAIAQQETVRYDRAGRVVYREVGKGAERTQVFTLYDEAGRRIAEVDGVGALTEYRYNARGLLAETVRYANRATMTSLLSSVSTPSGWVALPSLQNVRPAASAADVTERNYYDKAGRVARRVDALGYLTELRYDGAGRLISETTYSGRISTLPSRDDPPEAISLPKSEEKRFSRRFYDAEGLLIGELDRDGYLTRYEYDALGRLWHQVRYAQRTVTSKPDKDQETLRQNEPLANLIPSASPDDQHDYTLYDKLGRLVAKIDAAGYLTERVYDLAGNLTEEVRYSNQLPPEVRPTSSFGDPSVLPRDSWGNLTTRYVYNAIHQVVAKFEQRPIANQTLETRYGYDQLGQLALTASFAQRGDAAAPLGSWDDQSARVTLQRRDSLGRVLAELSGEAVRRLSATTDLAAREAIWKEAGQFHEYDVAGRRIATWVYDPSTQAAHKTRIFYDEAGRVVGTVGPDGAVTTQRYNLLGQLTETHAYSQRLPADVLTNLQGGTLDVEAHLSGLKLARTDDVVVRYQYNARGERIRQEDGRGFVTTFEYDNAFSELRAQTQALRKASRDPLTNALIPELVQRLAFERKVDSTGIHRTTTEQLPAPNDVGELEVLDKRVVDKVYDAFGRLVKETSATNVVIEHQYDHLGRELTTRVGGGETTFTYDAFSRVLTKTDREKNTTKYVYSEYGQVAGGTGEKAWSVQVITPEGEFANTVPATTEYNVFGELIWQYEKNGETFYGYDLNGRQISQETLTRSTFSGGWAPPPGASSQAKGLDNYAGIEASFTWKDWANPEVELAGLNPLNTRFYSAHLRHYDAQGRLIGETETISARDKDTKTQHYLLDTATHPDFARKTTYQYDVLNGTSQTNLAMPSAADPLKARATVRYTDALGRVVKEQGANGTVTLTEYDAGGRVKAIVVDPKDEKLNPNGLALRTEYEYDGAGHTIKQIEGAGSPTQRVTTYQYDAAGRRIREQVGDGYRTISVDIEYRYDAEQRVVAKLVHLLYGDRGIERTQYVYDDMGRKTHEINGMGEVKETVYDAEGRVVMTRRFAQRVGELPILDTLKEKQDFLTKLDGKVDPANPEKNIPSLRDNTLDAIERFVYDRDGRLVLTVDAEGGVIEKRYQEQYEFGWEWGSNDHGRLSTEIYRAERYTQDPVLNGPDLLKWINENHPKHSDDKQIDYTRDPQGRVIATEVHRANDFNDVPTRTTTRYNYFGEVEATGDAAGMLTHYRYDAAGREIEQVDPTGLVTETRYDDLGRTTEVRKRAARSMSWGQFKVILGPDDTITAYGARGERFSVRKVAHPNDASLTAYELPDERPSSGGSRSVYTSAAELFDALVRRSGRGVIDSLKHTLPGIFDYQYPMLPLLGGTAEDAQKVLKALQASYDTLFSGLKTKVGQTLEWRAPDVHGQQHLLLTVRAETENSLSFIDDQGRVQMLYRDQPVAELLARQPIIAIPVTQRLGLICDGNPDPNSANWNSAVEGWEALRAAFNAQTKAVVLPVFQREWRLSHGVVRFTLTGQGENTECSCTYQPDGDNQSYSLGKNLDLLEALKGHRTIRDALSAAMGVKVTVADAWRMPSDLQEAWETALVAPLAIGTQRDISLQTSHGKVVLATVVRTGENAWAWIGDDGQRRVFNKDHALYRLVEQDRLLAERLTDRIGIQFNYEVENLWTVSAMWDGWVNSFFEEAAREPLADVVKTLQLDHGEIRFEAMDGEISTGRYSERTPQWRTWRIRYLSKQGEVREFGAYVSLEALAADHIELRRFIRDAFQVDLLPRQELVTSNKAAVHAQMEKAVAQWFSPPPSTPMQDLVTRSQFDAAGRVTTQTTGADHLLQRRLLSGEQALPADLASMIKVEQFGYDVLGQKTWSINARGGRSTFQYDSVGRVIAEFAPAAEVLTQGMDPEADRPFTKMENKTVQVHKRYTYDGAGHLRELLEGLELQAGTQAADSPYARITNFLYDYAGRQTGVLRQFNRYTVDSDYDQRFELIAETREKDENKKENRLLAWYAHGGENKDPVRNTLTTRTDFDALGRASAFKDQGGNVSTKLYDKLGRVRFEVDAEGFVTEYQYDPFGNKTQQFRYASSLLKPLPKVNEQDSTVLVSDVELTAKDALQKLETWAATHRSGVRALQYTHDLFGRVLKVIEPTVYQFYLKDNEPYGVLNQIGRVTTHRYNERGLLIQQSVSVDAVVSDQAPVMRTADTHFYYDQGGRKIGQVDAEGYLTAWYYDEQGRLQSETQYAKGLGKPLAISTDFMGNVTRPEWESLLGQVVDQRGDSDGASRRVNYDYDLLGRQIAQTTSGDGGATERHVFDAADNAVLTIDARGNQTFKYYDALGRVRYTLQATGMSDQEGRLYTLTSHRYDPHGNEVEKVRYDTPLTESALVSHLTGKPSMPLAPTTPGLVANLERQLAFLSVQAIDQALAGAIASPGRRVETREYDRWGHLLFNGVANWSVVSGWPASRGIDGVLVGTDGMPTNLAENQKVPTLVTGYSYDAMGRVSGEVTMSWAVGDYGAKANHSVRLFQYDKVGRRIATKELVASPVTKAVEPPVTPPPPPPTTTPTPRPIEPPKPTDPDPNEPPDPVVPVNPDPRSRAMAEAADEGPKPARWREIENKVVYNGFGEIVRKDVGERKVGDLKLTYTTVGNYDYDDAGRMWRQYENGTTQLMFYNNAGWETARVTGLKKGLDSSINGTRPSSSSIDTKDLAGLLQQDDLETLLRTPEQVSGDYRRAYARYDRLGRRIVEAGPVFTDRIEPLLTSETDKTPVSLVAQTTETTIGKEIALSTNYRPENNGGVSSNTGWIYLNLAYELPFDVPPTGLKLTGKIAIKYGVGAVYELNLSENLTRTNGSWGLMVMSPASNPFPKPLLEDIFHGVAKAEPAGLQIVQGDGTPLPSAVRLNYPAELADGRQVWLRAQLPDGSWHIASPRGVSVQTGLRQTSIGLDTLKISQTPTSVQLIGLPPGFSLTATMSDAEIQAIASGWSEWLVSYDAAQPSGVKVMAVETEAKRTRLVLPQQQSQYDRWGNRIASIDALNQRTEWRYNQQNKVVFERGPRAGFVDAQGVYEEKDAVTRYQYNQWGDLVAARRDAMPTVIKEYDQYGRKVAEYVEGKPDEKRTWRYDGFGRLAREQTDSASAATEYVYNQADQVIAVIREGVANKAESASGEIGAKTRAYTRYVYDGRGQRVMEFRGAETWNEQQKTWAVWGDTQVSYTWYDTVGNVVQTQRRQGKQFRPDGYWSSEKAPIFGTVHQYDYDALGNKVEERMFDVWQVGNAVVPRKLDKNPYTVLSQTWQYYAGTKKLKRSVDWNSDMGLSGSVQTYAYNAAGELVERMVFDTQTKKNATQSYRYNEAGWRVSVKDQDGTLSKTTTTRYDALGRAIRERLEQRDTSIPGHIGTTFQSEQGTRYDALGRVELVGGPGSAVQYLYDTRDNRRAIFAMERKQNTSWEGLASWYQYDGWGRETVESGSLVAGTIQVTTSRDRWDDLQSGMVLKRQPGQVVSFQDGKRIEEGANSLVVGLPAEIAYEGTGLRRKSVKDASGTETVYTYDGLGQLIEWGARYDEQKKAARSVEHRQYDGLGRAIREETVNYDINNQVSTRNIRLSWFDMEDRVELQINKEGNADLKFEWREIARLPWLALDPHGLGNDGHTHVQYFYGLDRLDKYEIHDKNEQLITHEFTYISRNGWKEVSHGVLRGINGAQGRASTETRYDAFGNTTRLFGDLPSGEKERYFFNDADGRVRAKKEGLGYDSQYLYVGDARVGASGTGLGGNFDFHYSAAQDLARNQTNRSAYVVQEGDTLQRIAQIVWGDARLWYLIGEENGLKSPEGALTPGQLLKLPRLLNAHNDATVFTPHSPSEVWGDTSPALPAPPPPPKASQPCGGYGQAIIMIISIIVTVYTGQWVGGVLKDTFMGAVGSAIVGGAVGGAVGSATSQLGHMAIGLQDDFSWKDVGKAALRRAVTAGIGQMVGGVDGPSIGEKLLPDAHSFFQDITTGAVSGVLTEGLLSATGVGHFSWRNVAASAIAEPISKWVGNNIFGTEKIPGSDLARDHRLTANFANNLASGFINRVAQIATHGEGRLDWISLAGNAFGEMVGNEVVSNSRAYHQPKSPYYNYRTEIELEIEETLREDFMPQILGSTNQKMGFVDIDVNTRIMTNPSHVNSNADEMLLAMIEMLENPVAQEMGEEIKLASRGGVSSGLLGPAGVRPPNFEVARNGNAVQNFGTAADLLDLMHTPGLSGMQFLPDLQQMWNAEHDLKKLEKSLGYGARILPKKVQFLNGNGKLVIDYSATLQAYQFAFKNMVHAQSLVEDKAVIKSPPSKINHPPKVDPGATAQLQEIYDNFKREKYYCTDCALHMKAAAGGKGTVVIFSSVDSYWPRNKEYTWAMGGSNFMAPIKGGVEQFAYHSVYLDGNFFYDPLLSRSPIPKKEYVNMIREINPEGFTWRLYNPHEPNRVIPPLRKGKF